MDLKPVLQNANQIRGKMLKIHYFEEFFRETLAFSSSLGLENLDLKPDTKNLDFSIDFSFKYRSIFYFLLCTEVLFRSFYFCFLFLFLRFYFRYRISFCFLFWRYLNMSIQETGDPERCHNQINCIRLNYKILHTFYYSWITLNKENKNKF